MTDILKYPFVTAAITSASTWKVRFKEAAGSYGSHAIDGSGVSYDDFTMFLEQLADVINDAATYNTYCVYLDAERGRVVIEKVTGSATFHFDFSYDANTRALGAVLGYSTDVELTPDAGDRIIADYAPQYAWFPQRPMAYAEPSVGGYSIQIQTYDRNIRTEGSPVVSPSWAFRFEFLAAQKVWPDARYPNESWYDFWLRVRNGTKITVHDDRVIDASLTAASFTDSTAEVNLNSYTGSRESFDVVIYSLNKKRGARRHITTNDEDGALTISPNWYAANPAGFPTLKTLQGYKHGCLAVKDTASPRIERMDTQALLYKLELDVVIAGDGVWDTPA